jgi:adenylate cyclase
MRNGGYYCPTDMEDTLTSSGVRQRLVAILAADVAGYSRLMAVDERATVVALDAARRVFKAQIESHQGRVIDMAGDSVLAVFETATGAVAAALAIQETLAATEGTVPKDRRMRFRIGVHLGDVIEKADGTVYGDGVNIAARLEGLAEPGGITVSEGVQVALRNRVAATFEDQGEQQVKNISHPVRAFRVRGPNAAVSKPSGTAVKPELALPDKPSIAVLPFANMSGDPEQEYFADGMVEDIITALSRFRQLFVIARNSTFTYKGRAVDVRHVAKELGVRYVLEGSVRRAGHRVRITGQLIDAITGAHLWAERFDGNLEDIFDLQDRITEGLVGAIEPQIRRAEIERSRRKRPENLDAYDLYLRALPHAYAMRPEDNSAALELLGRAISLDPAFAAGLATAAWCYEQRLTRGWSTVQQDDAANAIRLARSAIATESDDAAAIAAAGFVLVMVGRDFDTGLAAVRRAVALNPNNVNVSLFAGWANNFGGDLDEALGHFERAQRLSPSDPGLFLFLTGQAMAHLLSGRYAQAAELALKSAAIYPSWDTSYWVLATANAELGRVDATREAVGRLLSLSPGVTIAQFARATPFADPGRLAILQDGLLKAGLPE